MQLLHLDSSLLGANSVSRRLSDEIVARQRALHPGLDVAYRDLAADPALHLSGAHMAARSGVGSDDPVLGADFARGDVYLSELFAADVVVIGAPMYNLSVPTPLKAWIDRISVAGTTFRYTDTGPEGLLKGKKVFIASARGGVYSAGSAAAALDHQESYLVGVLALLGMVDVQIIRAEGVATARDAAIAGALAEIAAIAA